MSDPNHRASLLLVEDEALIALAEVKSLEDYGYAVAHAASGEAAVAAALGSEPPFDLVLMDINLGPGIDGTEAARRIIAGRGTPVLFLSSHAERGVVERTEGISSYGYVTKHSGITVLDASIKMALKLRAADRALRASEEKHRVLVENSRDIIYTATAEGRFTFVSPSWTALLGHPVAAVVGTHYADYLHGDDVPACGEFLRGVLGTGAGAEGVEYRVRHADGSWRTHRSTAQPLLDAEGRVAGIQGSARDITGLKRAEEEARRARAILEAIPTGIYLYHLEDPGDDRTLRMVYANPAVGPLTGLGPGDVVGRTLDENFPGLRAQGVPARYAAIARGGAPVQFDDLVYGDDRVPLAAFAVRAFPLPGRHVGVAFDAITDRKRMELALRESEERLAATLQSIGDGVIACDRDGRVRDLNRAAEALTGWKSAAAAGRPIAEVFRIEDAGTGAAAENPVFRSIAEGATVGLANHTVLVARDEARRQIADSCAPIRDAGGAVIGAVLVFRDVTGEYERRAELERTQALLDAAFEQSPVPMAMATVPDLVFRYVNSAAAAFLGVDAARYRGVPLMDIPLAWKELKADGTEWSAEEQLSALPMPRALRGEETRNLELQILRADGSKVWELASGAPVRDRAGKLIAGLLVMQDVTALKAAQEGLRAKLEEQDILLKEVHHRIKNNIASVAALLGLSADAAAQEGARAAILEARARVESVQKLYEGLLKAESYTSLPAKAYLEELVGTIVGLAAPAPAPELALDLADVELDVKRLFLVGLALNELLTNALKYAFPGGRRGRIAIGLAPRGDELVLSVVDDGAGLPAGFDPARSGGFGLALVRMLAGQLKGRYRTLGGPGTGCELRFPAR